MGTPMDKVSEPAICIGAELVHGRIDINLDLLAYLKAQIERYGQSIISLRCPRTGEARAISYSQMWHKAGSIHQGLMNREFMPGDLVILALSDLCDLISATWACWMAGVVPLAAPLTSTRSSEWRDDLDKAVKLLIAHPRFRVLIHDEITSIKLPTLKASKASRCTIEELLSRRACFTFRHLPATKPAALFSSSGSTGVPKLVVLSRRAIAIRLQQSSTGCSCSLGEDNGALYWLPPHQAATFLRIMVPDGIPKTVLSTESFVSDPLHWLDLIEQRRVRASMMTSFGMGLIIRAAEQEPQRCWDLTSLVSLGIGAEPISPRTLSRFLSLIQDYGVSLDRVHVGYGLTEAGTVTTGRAILDGDTNTQGKSASVSVGAPCPGFSVRVVRKDNSICEMGEVGEIEVFSPAAADGYLGKPQASRRLRSPDGWLRTGDLGLLQGQQLTVTGRQEDVVIMNARKYSCHHIELALQESLNSGEGEVVACAVREDSDHTEALLIFFDPVALGCRVDDCSASVAKATLDQTIAQLRRSLLTSTGLVARAFIPLAQEHIPRTPSGKVKRSALTRAFLDGCYRDGKPAVPEQHQKTDTAPAADATKELLTPSQELLLGLWRQRFHDRDVGLHDDFFDLGGDSITAVSLLTEIEQRTGCRLPMSNLSAFTTIADLAARMDTPQESNDGATKTRLPADVELRLRGYLGGWPGKRRSADSLVVGYNLGAEAMPLFWCCQGFHEVQALAEQLGPEQPIYGMRSLHLIAPSTSYQVIQLAHSYSEEIAEIATGSRVAIGGNCQGSYVALELARELLKRGLDVSMLFLLEHHRPKPYSGRVALLHGTDNYADPHVQYITPELGWNALYPAGHSVFGINCQHGQFFKPQNVTSLAEIIGHGMSVAAASTSSTGLCGEKCPELAIGFEAEVVLLGSAQATGHLSWRLSIAVTNLSATPWPATPASGVRIGAALTGKDGCSQRLALEGGDFPDVVPPGDTNILDLSLVLPETTKRCTIIIDVVQEGVAWFHHHGGRALHLTLSQHPHTLLGSDHVSC